MPTLKPSNRGCCGKTAPARPRASESAGFTLIEMLVVLTILSLVAMVAAQTIGRRPATLIWQEGGAKLAAAVQTAKREAARSGNVQAVSPAALVPGATLTGALPLPGGRSGLVLLYPDGSSTGGTVLVNGRALATIDWLTSEVRDAP